MEYSGFCGTQMKRMVRNRRKRCEQYECCSHQSSLSAMFQISPPPPLISFHHRSLYPHHLPPPFISLSFYLSACLFQDKNPTTVVRDRTPGWNVDVFVAKVMTSVFLKHTYATRCNTHTHINNHIHLCCQHFRLCMSLSDKLFEDISEAMWVADYSLGATSNEILAQRLQVWHL